ncbi:arsenate reductase ArsC [Bordetella genomosp. 13]|uniref:Protein-tyrosine-phosphatase n=1 Tax=Bordetella genomosp. 13 TaxID=463040 RepID=A0A1W6ZAI1_9BORD|nr:arsenate reductase ArsC [Bordetella genomosp. 13]ARP94170.1 protein-tyrosine-phosphatase [Bordetella genomosp. 13]
MPDKLYHVLFVCTGNSARSILAEGLLNGMGKGRFQAHSAGSHPRGEVHPLALATLQRLRMPATGYRSKSWDEYAGPDAPPIDFIITVCDNAAGEMCPVWPGQPMSAHWGVPDPAAVLGSEESRTKAFQEAAVILKRRIELFLSLPLSRLNAMATQRELQDIGKA